MDTFSSVNKMNFIGALSYSRTKGYRTTIHCFYINSLQFWIKVLNEPVESNIIAIVLFPHYLSHLQQQMHFCVVKIHEVTTHKGNSHKSYCIIFGTSHTIVKAFCTVVVKISYCICYDRPQTANCIILPGFESSRQLFAVHRHIIVDNKVDLSLALGRQFVAPIHRVIRSFVEIDRTFPLIFEQFNRRLFRVYFVVPDNIDFSSYRAIQTGIPIYVFFYPAIFSCSSMSHRLECKAK